MPVFDPSHGDAVGYAQGGNEQTGQWTSSKDTTARDSRRMSNNDLLQMDDTSLYDRSDWPLSNKLPLNVEHAPQDSDWSGSRHNVTKVDESAWLDKEDVSDIEEEHDHVSKEIQQSGGAEREHKEDAGEHYRERVSGLGLPHSLTTTTTSPTHMLKTQEEHIRQPSPQFSDSSVEQAGDRKDMDDDGRVSPVESSLIESSDDDDHKDDEIQSTTSDVSVLDSVEERNEQFQGGPAASPKDVAPVLNRALSLSNHHDEEQLDSTPPLPSETFRSSQEVPRSSSTQSNASRRPSDSILQPRHARHSSAAKAFQGYHSRQSSFNTTHVPSNRDRVRYSWQSVHEDESGKPRIYVIKLVSNTASASSAFPQGEAFGFSISPSGRRIAAFNSARLFILQTAALPVGISQDFSLKRRPLAVELNDSGSLVAILADQHTINVYDLSHSRLKRLKTLKLDYPTHCMAIAPCGGLVAAAYDGGIEVFSLAPSALPTDRRAVRSAKMDHLEFSEDGSTLLGTTTRIHASFTVIVSVPIFPAAPNGVPTPEELKIAWCSDLLHPENIQNSSHAAFMREDRAVRNEHVFAWNGLTDAFGVLSAADLEYGSIEFPLVVSPPLSTCGGLGAAIHSCPAVDEFGDAVAMIVNDRTIRLYMVPQVSDDSNVSTEAHSIDHELDDGYGCPFGEVRWVHSSAALPTPIRSHSQPRGRLVVTSPGGVYSQEQIEASFEEIEGGRIILFDFDPQFTGQPGQTFILNLGKSPPQPLQEEEYDVDDAIALVRRRTVKQNNAGDMRPLSLGRAATTLATGHRSYSRPTSTAMYSRRTASILSVESSHTESSRGLPDLVEGVEASEALEEPFSNQAPRSQASLQRAASNAQRHRFQSIEEQSGTDRADNFMPLPEYTEEPNAPLPSRYRTMAGLDARPTSIPAANGHLANAYGPQSVPLSAPPGFAENFSAEQAFATATASMHSQRNAPMPRSLLRAYSNATNMGRRESYPVARSGTSDSNSVSINSNEEQSINQFMQGNRNADDDLIISPIAAPANSMIARAYDNRFSTPLSSIPTYPTDLPRRSSSTRRPGESVYGTSRNYNVQAFRQAAATASLFPPTQSSDQLPLPAQHRAQHAGTVAHPITSWRPPAPSAVVTPQSPSHGSKGHSRKSSLAGKSAFASTAKARKLGFFKKKAAGRRTSVMAGNAEDDDSKSMMTWVTAPEKKCAVM